MVIMMRHNLYTSNFKFKFIIKATLIVFIVIFGLEGYGQVVHEKSHFHGTMSAFYELSQTEELDIIFFGSSHTFCTYNPKIFDDILNVNSYNIGNNSQRLTSTKYIIDEALKYHKPQLVVIDLYYPYLKIAEKEEDIKKQYSNLDYSKLSFNKIEFLLKNFPRDFWVEAYFKGIRQHDNWKGFDPSNYSSIGRYSTKYAKTYKGFVGFDLNLKEEDLRKYKKLLANDNIDKKSNWNLNKEEQKTLYEIIKLCKKENIQILFATAPYPKAFNSSEYASISSYIKDISDNYNINYLDFNFMYDKLNLTEADFKDLGHLNYSGANKVSIFLTNYIKENYYIKSKVN